MGNLYHMREWEFKAKTFTVFVSDYGISVGVFYKKDEAERRIEKLNFIEKIFPLRELYIARQKLHQLANGELDVSSLPGKNKQMSGDGVKKPPINYCRALRMQYVMLRFCLGCGNEKRQEKNQF